MFISMIPQELIHIKHILPDPRQPRRGVGGDDAAELVDFLLGGGRGAVHPLADLHLHLSFVIHVFKPQRAQYRAGDQQHRAGDQQHALLEPQVFIRHLKPRRYFPIHDKIPFFL